MNKKLLVLLTLAAAPAITLAQGAPPTMGGVADPASAVAAPAYRSAFGATPMGVVTDMQSWAEANAAVGQFPRGHMDIVRWERAQEAASQASEAPPATPQHREGAR